MNTVNEQYSQFANRRRQLLSLTERLEKLLTRLQQETRRNGVSNIKSKIESDDFKVMVLGAFKTGKSTLINALLREEVLPAYATPCTAVINEIKWADRKRAVLHFTSPMPDSLPEEIPDRVREHILQYSNGSPPPLEVNVDQLEEYVVIRDPAAKHGEASPFEKVELFWPLEICKNGVQIIDSPGLNEHAARERVTMDYLTQADAVMFTLNCAQLASMAEMDFFDTYVLGAGHESTFFVCNRIDTVRPRSEQQRIKDHGMQKLVPLTLLKDRGVHFISAADALDARVVDVVDQELLAGSGLLQLEQQLALFLVNERGRIKLIRPARELRRVCEELIGTVLPSQLDMLEGELDVLDKKHEELQPKLKEARLTRDRIVKQIGISQRQMEKDVTNASRKALRDVIEQVPEWAETSEVTTSIKVFTLKHKEIIEGLVKEVSQCIERRIHDYVKQWKTTKLAPLLEKHAKEMNQEIAADIEAFYVGIDVMHAKMAMSSDKSVDDGKLSGKERFLASMAGFFIGDIYSGLHGARFGFTGLGVAIGTQIALVVAMMLLGVANPFIIIPVLLGGGLVNAFVNAEGMTGKIKKKVGVQFAEALQNEVETFTGTISQQVMKEAAKFRDRADKALSNEILQVEDQIASVLEAKRKGELVVKEAKRKLLDAQGEVQEISSNLFDLAAELATDMTGVAS